MGFDNARFICADAKDAAKMLLEEFRNGKMGRLTLDRVKNAE